MDKDKLKEWVSGGELGLAFEAMLGYGKSQKAIAWYNALLIQHNQFKTLEIDKLKGVLSADEEVLIRNRILSALLSLIDDLPDTSKDNTSIDPLPLTPTPESSKTRWPLWLLIGAVALLGLILAYSKLDSFNPDSSPESAVAEAANPEGNARVAQPLHFPEGNAVNFVSSTGDEISYRILQGELKDQGGGAQQLSFNIRCSARKGNGANFWDDTFRLELDEADMLLAPSSGLNELVANNSSKDGTVAFEIREAFSSMHLAIINPWNKDDIRKLAVSL